MHTLPANLILEKNKVAAGSAWLVLLDITLNDDAGTVIRLVRNNENITFGGNTYTAFSFELAPIVSDSKGQLPLVELSVSNITHVLQPYLLSLKGAVGSVAKITVVNSALLAEDYSELELEFNVIATESTRDKVTFRLGATNPLIQRFPLYKYIGLHCGWKYKGVECGYVGKTIASVTLSGSSPVAVGVTAHGFSTGDMIELESCNGITGGLEGSYSITKTGDNAFTLDDTISSNYGGSYTSGGKAGYSTCNRTLNECRFRGRSVYFGGFPAMRARGIRVV